MRRVAIILLLLLLLLAPACGVKGPPRAPLPPGAVEAQPADGGVADGGR